MDQRRCVVSKSATNNGSESEIKSSTDVFTSVIEKIMGYSVKNKVNIVQLFNKVSVCVLALWILNCPSNQTNFTEKWDNSSNNGDIGRTPILMANKNRSLSQVDVLRMTTYDSNFCKPWDKACSYSEVPKVRVEIQPPSMPPKGPNNMPSRGPPLPGPPNGHPKIPPNGLHQNGPVKRPLHGPPNGHPKIPPNGLNQNGPVKGPLHGPPNGHPKIPPNGLNQNGPVKGPLHGPPNGRPQIPPNGLHQNGSLKGLPLRGPPNGRLQVPPNAGPQGPAKVSPPGGSPNASPQNSIKISPPRGPPNAGPQGPIKISPRGPPQSGPQGPIKISPPRGPPKSGPQGPIKISPPRGPPKSGPQGPIKISPPRGPPNAGPQGPINIPPPRGPPSASPSNPDSEGWMSPPSVNKSKIHSEENLPPFPARKCTPRQPIMFEHNKKFFQQTEANKKLEFINPSYQNLRDMKNYRDNNKIVVRSPPSDIGKNVNPADNMKLVRPPPHQIRVKEVKETENEFLTEFKNTLMSNIYEVEMNRDPALELIKENIIDNIILANQGVKRNIDMIRENIANTLKTLENGDWKPPIESIKGTILEKIGNFEPEDIKPKCEEIGGAIMEKIATNIETNVKPKLDNIKLTVLDTLDDINNEVVQPKINDIKDTINRNIGNLEYEMIPKIGKTIKECVTDTIGDISTGIGKTSETIKDTVMTNVKSICDNVPVAKNIKEMANKATADPELSMEQNLINSVTKSALGFSVFGDLRNRFKKLGNTTKAIGGFIISFLLAIGGIVGIVTVNPWAGGGFFFVALLFAYYAIMKQLGKSLFSKFSFKKNSSSKKKSKENKDVKQKGKK
ncbi:Uncharacterized protein PCOAH_00002370 [Plasmodium coatneyi]|uniref:Uncharacterized protein n=1 Tax=Plasmodium coatneyi TaxID=208452 RepID=A0A1B1DT16_9APIC|nr:Uncharacterized protein PCOAH_00002370 [Plasmodium coatneyi]ANQ05946.1 Uncharacterized protein PCOAH_00002370 [Plasmodium coatneyi]